ncbi:XdhC family protein [Paenibacillus crassostreae]|uniref:Xanthine dehydrogenase n=1 Tax=Paenibacillus crassostreae TaxID=1763538 RepID=A0A167B587_9BACL|nr:XdhC family protein [Paenibacillus crassostreae]AOZ93160.1 hypothetical protein LPB68_13700 [Paenibacillus crassostreae]OAB71750.1 hypothetical protein PNBC_17190 [Paenibacillus crassostreae]
MYDIILHLKNNDSPAVLATLIGVEGHSYRKVGAVMLFFEEGMLGSLSPGCLESDLQLRTEEIWKSGMPEMVEYDMLSSDDLSWGEVMGCGGRIKVLLEPVRGELRQLLVKAYARIARGEILILQRESNDHGYSYRLVSATTTSSQGDHTNFSTLLEPKPRLVIFGGSHDAGPIAELAERVGFRITVADWREGSLHNKFPGAEKFICHPMEMVGQMGIGCEDYVLICSHHFQRDRQFLESLIPVNPHYIGIVGSTTRISRLLEGIDAPASLHAPVGISIGGQGPEEIAVSIVAEMIRVRRLGLANLSKGVEFIEYSRHLSGSGTKQKNGYSQSLSEVVAWDSPWECRA